MKESLPKQSVALSGLTLFTSLGTLLCCALPALLVSLGLGAVLAGLVSAAPWLIWLSKYKIILFAVAGVLLAVAGGSIWYARRLPCPLDPKQANTCQRLRKWSVSLWLLSLVIFAVGFYFAFVAVYFL